MIAKMQAFLKLPCFRADSADAYGIKYCGTLMRQVAKKRVVTNSYENGEILVAIIARINKLR